MKKFIQRMIGMVKCKLSKIKVERACYVGINVKVVNNGTILCKKNVTIRPFSHIYAEQGSEIIFHDNVEIGRNSTISSQRKIILERGVLTGPHVFIADHNHEYKDINTPIYAQGVSLQQDASIHIGEGSWLGTNAVVVGNVNIGKHCIIGANSVVTKDIPDYCVAAGIPAKVIKQYNFETKTWEKIKKKIVQ